MTWLIAILSFFGSIAIFLFKKIVIEPLQKSINSLDVSIKRLEESTSRQLDLMDNEIDFLKIKTTRDDEQIKTLFNRTGGTYNEN
mgnify:FL=1